MKKSIKTAMHSILALSIITSAAQTSEAMTYYDIYDEELLK